MIIYNLCKNLFKKNGENLQKSLSDYFCDELLEELYFIPKKIDKNIIAVVVGLKVSFMSEYIL